MNQSTEQIWQEHHTRRQNFIRSRVSDAAMAEDILQDVFTRIHTRIDTLKASDKMQSWIYQISRNAIIDYYRKQKNTAALPEGLMTSEIEDPNKDQAKQDFQNYVLPMIASLP